MSQAASRILVRKLEEGKEFLLKVVELEQAKENFPGKNGNTTYCHFFLAEYSEFPEPVEFQWCVQQNKVVEFKVGDTIKVKAGQYVASKNRQSVTFLSKIINDAPPAPVRSISKPQPPIDPVKTNSNPAVMGTLWSICVGHAVNLHKDRKGSTMKDVLIDAALLQLDYKNTVQNDQNH